MDAATITDGAAGGGVMGAVVILAGKLIDKIKFSRNGKSSLGKTEAENMILNHKISCTAEMEKKFNDVKQHTTDEVGKLQKTIVDILLNKGGI